MGKIIQTAGRNTLGEFAPEFAHFNDDVLFGENDDVSGVQGTEIHCQCHAADVLRICDRT